MSAEPVAPPVVSEAAQLLLDITTKQEANCAYNEAAIAAVEDVSGPGCTHYLGRAASVPAGGSQTTWPPA